ncbi:SWI5-dependent HO expression protein 4, partial [Spiromyces aspiralis]
RTDASPDQVRILVRGVLQVLRTEANGSLKSLTQPAITQSSTPPWSEEALATAKHSGSVVLLSELLGDVATTGGDSEREPLVLKLSQQIKVQVEDWIQSTKQAECALGLYCLATIFSIDRRGRIALPLLANTDLLKDAFELAEYNAIPTQIALLTLCNEAFADSSCRSLIASHGRAYIAAVANQNKDAPEGSDRRRLFGLASSVLAKVYGAPPSAGGRGMTGEGEMPGGESGIKELSGVEEEDQTSLLRAQVDAISLSLRRSSAITASLATHVESLNYLSLRGRLKDRIASNQQLLADLYAAVRRISGQGNFEPSAVPVITAFRFSVVALSQNLTQYLPELNEEQKALQKLQKRATNPGSSVAGAGGKDSSGRRGEEQDEESHKPERVQARSALVVKAGCVSCLSEIVRGQRKEEEGEGVEALSDGIKDLVAQTLCNLATTPGLRGLIAQQGGIGALMRLFSRAAQEDRRVPPKPFMRAEGGKQVRDFVVAQALAKIAISLPPHLAFPGQTAFGLVRPFLALCVGEENGLAQFEALMALTNLASMPPGAMEEGRDIRTVIAFDQKGLGVIEYLALSEHFMIRRAATELLCNLIADYEVYEHYASHAKPTASGEVQSGDGGKDGDKAYRTSRIHMFVALLDSEDTPTRMATGGALATLTMDSRVCEFLVLGHPTAMDIILRVAGGKDAESKQVKEGLCHRGIAMLANMVGQKRDNKAIFDKIRADRRVERLLREAARGEVVESEVVIGLARKALNDLAEVPADDA